ncbi:MAG: biotin/lipoyl-binding protein [Armatimonadetes bacterium]|nr:biotin/lipoyl-binding protein [Armatimonadota bacterium]
MDLTQVAELVAAVCSSRTVTEMTLREGTRRLVVRRAFAVEAPQPEVMEAPPADDFIVCSPLVGFFHQSASAKCPPVTVGMAVRDGQVLGAIESMSVLYDVTAEVSGVITEVLVEEGQPVEYGQELFRIQRAPDGESAPA